MAPPTAYHVIFCSCPLALFLLLFTFTSNCLWPAATRPYTRCATVYVVISYPLYRSMPLSLFPVFALVVKALLSSYNFPLYFVSNGEEEEDGGAVLRQGVSQIDAFDQLVVFESSAGAEVRRNGDSIVVLVADLGGTAVQRCRTSLNRLGCRERRLIRDESQTDRGHRRLERRQSSRVVGQAERKICEVHRGGEGPGSCTPLRPSSRTDPTSPSPHPTD